MAYYRKGAPKTGRDLSAKRFGIGGRTVTEVARWFGDITQQGVSRMEIRTIAKLRGAMTPLRAAGEFSATDPTQAKDFVRALTDGLLEAEENERFAEVVATRAEQIVETTGCTPEEAVIQATRELFGKSSHD